MARCGAAFTSRPNEVDVKRSLLTDLRNPAIFTAVARAIADATLQRKSNVLGAHPPEPGLLPLVARRRKSDKRSARSASPSASTRSSSVRG